MKKSGQSDVWEAVRLYDNMKVALKKFRGDKNEATDCSITELKALVKLKHPNVINVLEFYWDPAPCLVMEFIDGPTLSEFFTEKGHLPAAIVTKVLRGIGEGLEYLHRNQVVHRDLKPANIILEGTELKPVLIDLGLAKSTYEGSTPHLHGTHRWMAPEMLDLKDDKFHFSDKSDVYAMGIIMWQTFTGKIPYPEIKMGPDELIKIGDFIKEVKAGTRPSLSGVTAAPHLIELMKKCWDGLPSRRPSMGEFLLGLSPGGNDL